MSTVRPALHMPAMVNGHTSLQARTVPQQLTVLVSDTRTVN